MINYKFKYIMLSLLALIGLALSLYADLKIGEYLYGKNLDNLIKQITLILAFDITIRESLRFSLLKVFSSAENDKHREGMFEKFSLSLIVVGFFFSFVYSGLYSYIINGYLDTSFFLNFSLFLIMFIGAGLQLILNLTGLFFMHSLRVALFPLSILCWLFLLNDHTLESNFLIFFLSYCFMSIYSLRHILRHISWKGNNIESIKRYFIPPLFPMANYSFLQTSRYLERSLVASVSVGSSYYIYFSFKLYAAFISLIGMPVSVILSKFLVNDKVDCRFERKKLLARLFVFILVMWLLGVGTLSSIWIYTDIEFWFPKITDEGFLGLIMLYLLAAFIGSINITLQVYIYKYGGHMFMMKAIMILSTLYMLFLLIGANFISDNFFSYFVAIIFLIYTLSELFMSFIFLKNLSLEE